uniref:Uncharacterized protein n=1 Tax=Fagus sylvatica TaxID=28930 RepID=A0A2N9HCW0_FAGSY
MRCRRTSACQLVVRSALRAQLFVFLRGGDWLLASAPPLGFNSLCRWTGGYGNNEI